MVRRALISVAVAVSRSPSRTRLQQISDSAASNVLGPVRRSDAEKPKFLTPGLEKVNGINKDEFYDRDKSLFLSCQYNDVPIGVLNPYFMVFCVGVFVWFFEDLRFQFRHPFNGVIEI